MSKIIEFNSARIDESSQILLQILVDYGGSTDIRTLRQEADLDQASQVHYRFENHLGPDDAGLMKKEGIREVDGQEMTVFSITNEGQRFLDLHENNVLDAVGAAKAVESLNRMQEQLADFETRLDTVTDDIEEQIESRYGTRFSRLKNDLESLEKGLSGKADVDDVGEIEDRVEELEEFEEAVQESFKNADDRLTVLYANQLELADALDDAGLDITLYENADDIDEDRYKDLRESLTR